MADNQDPRSKHVGDDLGKGAQKAAKAAKKTKNSVKAAQKAAAKAAAGNYAGAALEVLKDENFRQAVAVVVIISLLFTIAIYFAAPMALYAAIIAAKDWMNQKSEQFDEIYYSGTSGRVASFFKAIWGVLTQNPDEENIVDGVQDTTAGTDDNPTEDDFQLIGARDPYSRVYLRKLNAIEAKVNARQEQVINAIKNTTPLTQMFQNKFDSEVKPLYAGRDDISDVIFDGATVEVRSVPISKRAAAYLLMLYSTQLEEDPEEVKVSSLLQWLGYNAGGGRTMSFYLGENRNVTGSISAWKGTFIPQYMVDEAKAIGGDALVTYQEQYGCSVVDYLLVINCQNASQVQPNIREEQVAASTEVTYRKIIHIPQYADLNAPTYSPTGALNTLSVQYPYILKYGTYTRLVDHPDETGSVYTSTSWYETYTGWYAERDPEAPPVERLDDLLIEVQDTRTITEYKTEVHASYQMYATVSVRDVGSMTQVVGMWEGRLPDGVIPGGAA